jgi:hypothetical protein
MSRRLSLIRFPVAAALAAVALAAVAGSTSVAVATTTQRCAPPAYPGAGAFTGKIQVTNASCTLGKRVVVAYYNCRTKSGTKPAGRCTSKVLAFNCAETRTSGPAQIEARVTCRHGTQRIVHSYQQTVG